MTETLPAAYRARVRNDNWNNYSVLRHGAFDHAVRPVFIVHGVLVDAENAELGPGHGAVGHIHLEIA